MKDAETIAKYSRFYPDQVIRDYFKGSFNDPSSKYYNDTENIRRHIMQYPEQVMEQG